jgi:flagellar motor protein MotB
MHDSVLNDENIGWPSYVDFLTSFAFVLIMFVTWSVNLIAGVEREQKIHESLERTQSKFVKAGFEAIIEGHKLKIPLTNKVVFKLSKADLDDSSQGRLREAGKLIAGEPDVKWIIVEGYSDRLQAKDEFFNWTLSVNRAEAVLRFLYSCTDCNYNPKDIRPKLVLYGVGDLESTTLKGVDLSKGVAGDRRVDIILDKEDHAHP